MAGWNYRILRHVDKPPKCLEKNYPNGVVWYGIHEVYYNSKDVPDSCTQNPAKLLGEEAVDIKIDMKLIQKAFDKPILEYSYFVNLGRKKRKNETAKSSNRVNKTSSKVK